MSDLKSVTATTAAAAVSLTSTANSTEYADASLFENSALNSVLNAEKKTVANSDNIPAVVDLTQNSASNSISADEKLTYAQALRNQGLEKSTSTENSQDS